MIRPTNFKIALSHLTSRVKQTMVATLSVVFGISMYIFMNGFMTGVNDIQTELAFSTLAHIRIYNDLPEDRSNLLRNISLPNATLVNVRSAKVIQYTDGIRNADRLIDAIKPLPGITGVTSQINSNVIFRNGSTKVNGQLSGVDAKAEDELFGISESIVKGSWEMLDRRSDGIIIGEGLAKKLGLGMSDILLVSTTDGTDRNFKIIGILKTTIASVDNSKAFVKISSARQLQGENRSFATDIQVNIEDFNQADELVKQISQKTDLKVESWYDANGQLKAGNDLRQYLAIAVSLTILLVAGFGIYNIMNMTVNEKIKEIAILKAMGFEGLDIVQIFLVQSIIIGFIGGQIGILFGWIVSSVINQIPFEVATLETLPMSYETTDYLSAFGFGLLTTFVAGYLPAKKASKVDPVEIIRG
ncbi:MAG: FtsX-like permease family protein [Bacteroidota bacterium]